MENKPSRLRVRDLRPINRAAMLRLLRDRGASTRVALARELALSHSAVTNIAGSLIADGVVVDGATGTDTGPQPVGRPATRLSIVPRGRLVLGVQVGVGVADLAVCDLLARIVRRKRVRFSAGADPAPAVRAVISGLRRLARGDDAGKLIGVGIGAPRLHDEARHTDGNPISPGWTDDALAAQLERDLGLPVVIDHNVRAMALAEARFGAWRGVESLAFLYVGTGVGAGLIVDGRPYRGGTHGVTELGHLPVAPNGPECRCGNHGCLEAVASEPAIARLVDSTARGPLRALLESGVAPTDALVSAAAEGDRGALAVYDELAGHFSSALVSVVNLLNPEVIVTGGFPALAGDPFLERLRAAVAGRVFPTLRSSVRIEATSFGRDVGTMGGAAAALDQFFYAPQEMAS